MYKENHLPKIYVDMIENTPSDFLLTEEDSIEYLLFLSRTYWNNLATIDIIDYEKLIYIELEFPDNYQIQNLISILKENIFKNYKYKNKLLSRIIDNNLLKMNQINFEDIRNTYFMDNIRSINTVYHKGKEVRN